MSNSSTMTGLRATALAIGLGASVTGSVQALSYEVQVTQHIDIGTVVAAASGDTVFRIDPNTGNVTRIAGTGVRSSVGATRALVTITCRASAPGDCTKNVNVRLGATGSPTRRARTLTRILFAVGTAALAGVPGSPTTPSFTLLPIGPNASKTFWVGADLGVAGDDSGLPSGDSESDFYVYIAESPATPTSGDIGRAHVLVLRTLAVARTTGLNFGSIVKPQTGSGTVTINPATGVRTVTGGTGLASPTPTAAGFTVMGEGGQALSITVPPSFLMIGPQTLTVTTTNSAAAAPMLSSGLGAPGTYAFAVGGAFPITANTLDGAYSGAFTVTVAYN